MKLWRYSGIGLIATGIIHTVVGLILGPREISDMARAGFFDSLTYLPLGELLPSLLRDFGGTLSFKNLRVERFAVFWFLYSGFFWIGTGILSHHFIKKFQSPLPASFGWFLLVFAVTGWIISPVSGFPIYIPQAVIIILADRSGGGEDSSRF